MLSQEVKELNRQVQLVQKDTTQTSNNDHERTEDIENMKKIVNKNQIDILSKINETKKDVEIMKKKLAIMESTLFHKIEQQIGKIVKDRMELYKEELQTQTEHDTISSSDGVLQELEDPHVIPQKS
jgi:hypothetical protein